MTGGAGGLAPAGRASYPAGARPGRLPPPARRPGFRLTVLAMPGVLVLAGLAVAWVGQRAAAATSARPVVAWALRPASNTVAIRLAGSRCPGTGTGSGGGSPRTAG